MVEHVAEDVTAMETPESRPESRFRADVPLRFNRFPGNQYNPVRTLRDQIRPREMFDRMVAVRFEVPLAEVQKSRKMTLTLRGGWCGPVHRHAVEVSGASRL